MKRVKAKGRAYWYFRTGRLDERGREVMVRTPDPTSLQFGAVYASLIAGKNRREQVTSALAVPQLVDLWRKSPAYRALSAGTRHVYDIYADRLCALLPTAPAGLVETGDIVKLVDGMAETPGAANLFRSTVASIYKWGRKRGHVENDPTKGIERLDMGEHDPWPTSLLTDALAAEDDRVRLGAHLLYYTAQRIGDVCAMRWADIQGGVLRLSQKKTGKTLEINLHSSLSSELARTPRRGLTILTTDAGRGVSALSLRTTLQAWAKERGVSIVPHGLRKNAVNALLEAGCSVAETAAISGQSLQLVEYYAKQRNQPKLAGAAILKWEKSL